MTRAKARKSSANATALQKQTSQKHDLRAGKRAQHEENVTMGDPPRKKGKWAGLPTHSSHWYVYHASILCQLTEHCISAFVKSTRVSVRGGRYTGSGRNQMC